MEEPNVSCLLMCPHFRASLVRGSLCITLSKGCPPEFFSTYSTCTCVCTCVCRLPCLTMCTHVHVRMYLLLHTQINGLMHAYEECLFLTIERRKPLPTTGKRISGGNTCKPVPLPRKNLPPVGSGGPQKEIFPTPHIGLQKPTVVPRRSVTSPNRTTHCISDFVNTAS